MDAFCSTKGYRRIAEILIEELDSGKISSGLGNRFYTRSEIAARFSVAPLTAYNAIKYVAERGYISCNRGSRAVIKDACTQTFAPVKPCNVCIVHAEDDDFFFPSSPLGWMRERLTRRLYEDGHVVMQLSCGEFSSEDAGKYHGAIVFGGGMGFHRRWTPLKEHGTAVIGLTLSRLGADTLCVMPDQAVLTAATYMSRRKIREIVVTNNDEFPFDSYMKAVRGTTFSGIMDFLGCPCRIRNVPASDVDALDREIFSTGEKSGKAFMAGEEAVGKMIAEKLIRFGRKTPRDFLVFFCGACGVPEGFPGIDLKLREFTSEVISMLYRRMSCHNSCGSCRIHVPDFVSGGEAMMR